MVPADAGRELRHGKFDAEPNSIRWRAPPSMLLAGRTPEDDVDSSEDSGETSPGNLPDPTLEDSTVERDDLRNVGN